MDDAFIYFRYVDNFLFLDAGLTYNQGEFVEGFTSPAHCLLLIALRSMRWGYPTIAVVVGAISFTVFWYLLVVVNRELLPPSTGPARTLNVPLAYLSTNYAVTSYFTSGLEAPLALVWGALFAALFVRPSSTALAIAVGAAPLVRPELALALGVAFPYLWWRNRRFPLAALLAALAFNAPWSLFRVWYYASLFPNTFYLKDTQNVGEGLAFVRDLNDSYHVLPLLVVFGGIAGYLAWRSRRGGSGGEAGLPLVPRGAMLLVAISLTAYVVKIGGAAIHGYYLWVPLVLAAAATSGLAEKLVEALPIRRRRFLELGAMIVLSAIVLSWHSPILPRHPLLMTTREKRSGKIADPVEHRTVVTVGRDVWKERTAPARQREFAEELARAGYRETKATAHCQTAYLYFENRWVHSYGLTDAFLARVDTPERRKGHKPGLKPLAEDLARIQAAASTIGRTTISGAVESGTAPDWVVSNRAVLDAVGRRVYNRHDWSENLRLALSDPGTIDPGNTYEVWRNRKRAERGKAPLTGPERGDSE